MSSGAPGFGFRPPPGYIPLPAIPGKATLVFEVELLAVL